MSRLMLSGLLLWMGFAMATTQDAYFAGGCFWCTQSAFDRVPGVVDVVVGYVGDKVASVPTYKNYAQQGFVEAVSITYNSDSIDYKTLIAMLWRTINPTDNGGQFNDRGPQYRAVIYYQNVREQQVAQKAKQELESSARFDKPIVTEISPFTHFYKAEEYHQDFYKKNPSKYNKYYKRSGRSDYFKRIWGSEKPLVKIQGQPAYANFEKPSDEQLRKQLTPEQYKVTQQNGTEMPFTNKFHEHAQPGIYVDIISGEPLFSSKDKFYSKSGWPSFTKPIQPDAVVELDDSSWFVSRTEVRSRYADSHLGHVFNDGPAPTGLRYCINSAALRFVSVGQLAENGLQQFMLLFTNQ